MAPNIIDNDLNVVGGALGAHPSEIETVEAIEDGLVVTMVHGYSYHIAGELDAAGEAVVKWFKPPVGYTGEFPRYFDEPSEEPTVEEAQDDPSGPTISTEEIVAALGDEAFTPEGVKELTTEERKEHATQLGVDGVNGNTAVDVVVDKFNQALYQLSQK